MLIRFLVPCSLLLLSACNLDNSQIQLHTRSLITQLPSRDRPPPVEKNSKIAVIGKGFSHEDSPRVHEVRNQIQSLGLAAFPELVASSEDPRYAYVEFNAAAPHFMTVGDVCADIIESQVDFYGYGYKGRSSPTGGTPKPHYIWHVRSSEGLQSWWQSRQNRTLRDLQLESLQWHIAQEKSAGFTDDAQRHLILDPLEQRLKELTASH